MIYLFDNCYLSTPNTIVENSKQIWIGNHPNMDDSHIEYAFDIYRTYADITAVELDELFAYIHDNFAEKKTVIYCDADYFQYVYSVFFNGVLSKKAVLELYSYDSLKENLRIGDMNYGLAVTGIRKINRIDLPETLKWTKDSSEFSAALTNQRVEIEFANALQSDTEAMAFCVDRVDEMYDGSPGFWLKYAEQTLPGIMSDEEFTADNLLNAEFMETYLSQFNVNEYIPNAIVPVIKDKFGYDYHEHFFSVMNDTEDYADLLAPVLTMSKKEFIETRMLDPKIAIKFQLLFPNLSNFDSVNPIFWNAILQNQDNKSWLKKYKVTHGTDNQTN